MNHSETSFNTPDNTRIYHQSWAPDTTPKAVIIVVHGLGEHSGRYMNLVNGLVPQGYVIHGLDHIGHGQSEGRREYIDSFDEYITTLNSFSSLIRSQYPDTPAYLLGHSMGGLISLRYLLDYQAEFSGAIISAPAIKAPASISGLTIALGKIISILFPKMGLLPVNPDAISRDAGVVRAYLDDPLVYTGKTPARLAAEILRATHHVIEHAEKINLPMIILQGTADNIVDPDGAQLFHNKIASEDKTLKLYQGLYHEVLNEPEHADVLADILAWLEVRV